MLVTLVPWVPCDLAITDASFLNLLKRETCIGSGIEQGAHRSVVEAHYPVPCWLLCEARTEVPTRTPEEFTIHRVNNGATLRSRCDGVVDHQRDPSFRLDNTSQLFEDVV